MKYFYHLFLTSLILFTLLTCSSCRQQEEDRPDLYQGFADPPSDARPFVRWWWNGDKIEEKELLREIDVLHKAGFGGVEINPVAMPGGAKDIGAPSITWLSEEWTRLLGITIDALHGKGMIADMIVGSGWPFGGDFLKEEETIQCVRPVKKTCKAGETIDLQAKDLFKTGRKQDLLYLSLLPDNAASKEDAIDLLPLFKKNGTLHYQVPQKAGTYTLIAGVHSQNYTKVILGAPGADGPVMNHYRKEVTYAYLERLEKISRDLGKPLSELLRALFCDSIELSGSNWTDGFADIFYNTYHYKLEPYYPFVFYNGGEGYPAENYDAGFADELKRVRYDFNRLLVNTFIDNFTRVLNDFCHKNGLKSRYQAYGNPLLMGMLDGYMVPDIPEANSWLWTPFADIENRSFNWNQKHGSMIWNLYAASAAHNTGKPVVSCEAFTSLNNVYNNSLEVIKAHDDINFITGINHSVLHGFNYSPREAGFPGWIRYGTYFSEQNTWWPYVDRWVDYNARLSYIFQHSRPEKTWAVLAPESDHWSESGLYRVPFQTQPWYCFHLWESFSQAGSSLDYVNENILQNAIPYKGVVLCNVKTMSTKTAEALKEYVGRGGKLVYINQVPSRSLTMAEGLEGDKEVKNTFAEINRKFADRITLVNEPADSLNLLPWSQDLIRRSGVKPDIEIARADRGVYQIHSTAGEQSIYFLVNTLRREHADLDVIFPAEGKKPWLWDPETGKRYAYPAEKEDPNHLKIHLGPLESMLLVFEPASAQITPSGELPGRRTQLKALQQASRAELQPLDNWKLHFKHLNGKEADHEFKVLPDLKDSKDAFLQSFAGVIEYKTGFQATGEEKLLLLGKINKGISEVFINGRPAGLNWYGTPFFDIEGLVRKGKNTLTIRYTTILNNYCRSLKDVPAAANWTRGRKPTPCGLTGSIQLASY